MLHIEILSSHKLILLLSHGTCFDSQTSFAPKVSVAFVKASFLRRLELSHLHRFQQPASQACLVVEESTQTAHLYYFLIVLHPNSSIVISQDLFRVYLH